MTGEAPNMDGYLQASVDMADCPDPRTGAFHRLAYPCATREEATEATHALLSAGERMGLAVAMGITVAGDTATCQVRFAAVDQELGRQYIMKG
jgi:hypothetical protein